MLNISPPLLVCFALAGFSVLDTTQADPNVSQTWVLGVAVVIFLLAYLYLLPSILAYRYHSTLRHLTFGLNFILGWTVIVWAFCLFGLSNQQQAQIIYIREK